MEFRLLESEERPGEFSRHLRLRLNDQIQLTTVDLPFGPDAIDFAVPVKEERRKYSPSRFIGTTVTKVYGEPEDEHISTSYVERSNLTWRMSNRRMTRLTNAFSKKLANHAHHLAINFMHYNFVRIHRIPRTTPAVAAGVAENPWKMSDLLDLGMWLETAETA